MRRTALLAAIVLNLGILGATAPSVQACEGVDCFVACVKAAVNNPKDPVCPA